MLALLVYGLMSSPTPDVIGPWEVLIGICLILTVNYNKLSRIILGRLGNNARNVYLYLIFWMLFFSFMFGIFFGGIIFGNNLEDIVRDIIPLIYMGIVVLFADFFDVKTYNRVVYSLVLAGFFLSMRFYSIDGFNLSTLGTEVFFGSKDYLSMDPIVLFASVFMLGIAMKYLTEGNLLKGFICIFISVYIFGSILAVVARAPILLYGMAFVYFLIVFQSSIVIRMLRFIFLAVFLYWVWVYSPIYLGVIFEKFSMVGFNSKDVEVMEIIREIGRQAPFSGLGWGGSFDSTAADGVVRYSHNFLAYLWLKLGFIVGTLFFVIKISLPLLGGYRVLRRRREIFKSESNIGIVLVSCLIALLPAFFLQGSYKSLSFGVLFYLLYQTLYCPASSCKGLKCES